MPPSEGEDIDDLYREIGFPAQTPETNNTAETSALPAQALSSQARRLPGESSSESGDNSSIDEIGAELRGIGDEDADLQQDEDDSSDENLFRGSRNRKTKWSDVARTGIAEHRIGESGGAAASSSASGVTTGRRRSSLSLERGDSKSRAQRSRDTYRSPKANLLKPAEYADIIKMNNMKVYEENAGWMAGKLAAAAEFVKSKITSPSVSTPKSEEHKNNKSSKVTPAVASTDETDDKSQINKKEVLLQEMSSGRKRFFFLIQT